MPKPAAFCSCGAPLLLADEGAPGPLDATVELDRRGAADGDHRSGAAAPHDVGGRMELERLEVHVRHPESWRRAAAWAIDALPFAAAAWALARRVAREAGSAPASQPGGLDALLDLFARERLLFVLITAAVVLAISVYATLAHALAGATLGKRLLGLRVVGPDGTRPTPARSAVRSALALVSCALLGLGFLLALFTRSGRALHDLIARTWVVKAP